MNQYYSQNGEDFLLNKIFEGKESGFFVEVGCIDGKRFSNTLTFEERGWTGLCIEAHSDYIELLKKNRPNSMIFHCAVGQRDEKKMTFYANSRGSLSTLDKTKEKEFKKKFGKYFTGFEEQTVTMRTLNSIFKKAKVNKIDLLSIDIEGYEVEAIRGLELSCFRPKVIVVESDTNEHEKKLDEIILKNDYIKRLRIMNNIFYTTKDIYIPDLLNKKLSFNIIHTQHPLDHNGDVIKELSMTFKPYFKDEKFSSKSYLKADIAMNCQ